MTDTRLIGLCGGMAMKGFTRLAACSLMAAALMVAGTSVRAQAEDDDDVPFDQKIRNNFLGALGVKGGPEIDYKERSPLVLPPKIELPPPQANAVTRTPNWPVDADQKRRKEEAAGRRRDEVEESRPLRPNELNVGDRIGSRRGAPTQEQIEGKPSRPWELGGNAGILGSLWGSKKDESVPFTSEPPRSSLIEPPTGYQTPSPNAPYTAKYEKWAPKIPSFFDFGTDTK